MLYGLPLIPFDEVIFTDLVFNLRNAESIERRQFVYSNEIIQKLGFS